MDCLDENAVLDFVRGHVSAEAAYAIGAHLDECEGCHLMVVAAAKSSMVGWSSSRHRASRPSQDGGVMEDAIDVEVSKVGGAVPGGSVPEDRTTDRSLSALDTGEFVRSPEQLEVGQLLDDRFRLRRLLGSGAMGRIYAAYDERLRVQVALKMLLPALASSKAFLERLHQEIVVARRISHPNVCRVYDLGKSGDIHFISMELVDGETLEARLRRAPLSEGATVQVLRQMVAGLDAAHREGVIHRDLKPANIMIDARGHVTVMDFGLARDVHSSQSERENARNNVVGTPAYWSPEQGRGERATPASDIYSVGVIALRMFTGARGRLRPGRDPLSGVREPYRAVVARCLEPDPNKRFASADALQLAIIAAQRDRRPAWIPYVVGALGALAVATAVMALSTLRTAPATTPPSGVAAVALSAAAPIPAPDVVASPAVSPSAIPQVSVESLPSSPTDGVPQRGPASPTAHPSRTTHVPRPVTQAATPPGGTAMSRIPVFDVPTAQAESRPAAAPAASSRIPAFE